MHLVDLATCMQRKAMGEAAQVVPFHLKKTKMTLYKGEDALAKDLRRERLAKRQKLADAKKKATAVKNKLVKGAASRKRAPATVPAAAVPVAPARRARGVPG